MVAFQLVASDSAFLQTKFKTVIDYIGDNVTPDKHFLKAKLKTAKADWGEVHKTADLIDTQMTSLPVQSDCLAKAARSDDRTDLTALVHRTGGEGRPRQLPGRGVIRSGARRPREERPRARTHVAGLDLAQCRGASACDPVLHRRLHGHHSYAPGGTRRLGEGRRHSGVPSMDMAGPAFRGGGDDERTHAHPTEITSGKCSASTTRTDDLCRSNLQAGIRPELDRERPGTGEGTGQEPHIREDGGCHGARWRSVSRAVVVLVEAGRVWITQRLEAATGGAVKPFWGVAFFEGRWPPAVCAARATPPSPAQHPDNRGRHATAGDVEGAGTSVLLSRQSVVPVGELVCASMLQAAPHPFTIKNLTLSRTALPNVVIMTDSADVRRIALALPQTEEKLAWGMPTFRVAGKMFITLPDDETSFAVKCPIHERRELIAAEPEKFWVPPHEAGSAWVRVRLVALEDMQELRDILVDSWKQAAPAQLVDAFLKGD